MAGLPDRVDPLLFADDDSVLQLDLGRHSRYVKFNRGAVEVHSGRHPAPAASLSMTPEDFVSLCEGQLNQFMLLASGRAAMEGNRKLLEKARWTLFPMSHSLLEILSDMEKQFREEKIQELPTFPELSLEKLSAQFKSRRPFLVRQGWKAPPTTWTLDGLEREYGDLPFATEAGMGTLKEFIQRVRAGGFVNSNSTALPKALDDQIVPPSAIQGRVMKPYEIFFTSRGSYSSLHRDMTDGVVTCLLGPREFRIFSPDQKEELYCYKNAAHDYQACHVNTVAVDLGRFPRFKDARAINVTLQPGDLLYLPMGWFHQVVSLADSMALKFVFPDRYWARALS